jgi:hypothetical protein
VAIRSRAKVAWITTAVRIDDEDLVEHRVSVIMASADPTEARDRQPSE